jgi:hypothetical protein
VLAPFAQQGPLAALYFAKCFGAAAWIASAAWIGGRAAREAGASKARLVVLLPLALCAPLGAWAGAGMETGIVVALCTVAVGSAAPLAVLAAGLAAAMRPELIPWSVALALGGMVAQRRGASGAARALLLAAGPAALVAVARLVVFDHLVPLAFYAKPSDFEHGAFYVAASLLWTGAPLLVAAPWSIRRLDPRSRAVLVAAAVHGAALVFAGGDWMAFFRLFAPILPGLFLVGARLAAVAPPWATAVRVALASAMSALLLVTKGAEARGVLADRRALIDQAGPLLRGAHAVAALDVGWVGAATDADVVDLAGITDESIGRLRGGHTSKRIPEALLRHRHVDALVLLASGPVTTETLATAPWARAVEGRVAHEAAELGFEVRATLKLGHTAQQYVVLTLQSEP